MTDDEHDEVDMAHRARLRAEAEVADLTTRLRLAEASVALLRADMDAQALELRRLRAAEAAGTDDAAFEGTGWAWDVDAWVHAGGRYVIETGFAALKWGWADDNADDAACADDVRDFRLALDAMRAAVPGSL